MDTQDIAVIGSGIAGLSAAWLLSRRHRVTVFERESHLGGHSNTRTVMLRDGPVAVDTGFIVYNEATYPNLTALFEHLDVPNIESDMSFSFSLDDGVYEYNGTGIQGLFGQRANVVNFGHWRMLRDIRRFFTESPETVLNHDAEISLGDFLERENYSEEFLHRHILPMAGAIWSSPANSMTTFPARSFIEFYANHGLLKIRNRPKWRTVKGGSQEYVSRMIRSAKMAVRTDCEIASVVRHPGFVEIRDVQGNASRFDQVVFACHADVALRLMGDSDRIEQSLLKPFAYSSNPTVLHTDARHMPQRRRLWASWNYLAGSSNEAGRNRSSCTYWMNRLQKPGTDTDLFVTLNATSEIAPESILYETTYRHPILDTRAIAAQKHLWNLQGHRRSWFCGSYFGFGFHEDALQSGLAVAEQLGGVSRPWDVAEPSGRITVGPGLMLEAAE
jgi:predicted NAD/FAD-binding protein